MQTRNQSGGTAIAGGYASEQQREGSGVHRHTGSALGRRVGGALEFPSSNPELARIDTHRMPIVARDPRALCMEINLKWADALRLYRDGLISFDPGTVGPLDETQEAEISFVGSLVAVGCSRSRLEVLLRDLHRPYCYDIRRVFFDWTTERWRLLPGEDDPEAAFFALLDRLESRNEAQRLLDIREWLEDAIEVAHERESLFAHEELRGEGA